MEKIKINITTRSNLLIGGMPKTFEIGGVDTETITEYIKFGARMEEQPIIPASSLKGVLRRIVRDLQKEGDSRAENIKKGYQNYLDTLQQQNEELVHSGAYLIEKERVEAMFERFKERKCEASAEYLFGIQGFNDTPKLIFNDLKLKTPERKWYSLDSKNTICAKNGEIEANPRMYKTVRPGLTFCGELILYHINDLQVEGIQDFVKTALRRFNDGIYRLGNSGSRGYGNIMVTFEEE